MSKTRRLWNIIVAILMIQAALLLMLVPDASFILIVVFLSLVLTFKGLKFLIYYLTHAQHMVGGKWLMLVGLILLDMGGLAMVLIEQAPSIMIVYVAGVHLVYAVLGIARAVTNKGDGNTGWHRKPDLVGLVPDIHPSRRDTGLHLLRRRHLFSYPQDNRILQEDRHRVRPIT